MTATARTASASGSPAQSPAPAELDFGPPAPLERSLSALTRRLKGAAILEIAAQVRAMIAAGKPVCNLTVGDFDPSQFPIPGRLLEGLQRALAKGETNYPPSDGIPALRQAVLGYVARELGVSYPLESVLIASGGRPAVYAAYRAVLDPGDTVIYAVPSWNNEYYAAILEARTVELAPDRATGFHPTVEQLAPHLGHAALLCLCSPNNPTGTVLAPARLRAIMEAVVEENAARLRSGRRLLFVLYDQIYGALVYPPAEPVNPVALVPESAPYVITLDGISKAFAATGLRVGWALGAPAVISRMKDFLGHVGTWAPRAEQVATAEFLTDAPAVAAYLADMRTRIRTRLEALARGFQALKAEGHPVDCVPPEGAIYLSLQLDLVGRRLEDREIATNEDIRRLLLERAGLAVVPFHAFGLRQETGWFRLSAGAVSPRDIEDAFPRVRALLDLVR
jgi:aspartate aminotransferase